MFAKALKPKVLGFFIYLSSYRFQNSFFEKKVYMPEANQSYNHGVPLFFMTDSHPLSLFDLLQNHMSTSHIIRAHAQEVWDESDKD